LCWAVHLQGRGKGRKKGAASCPASLCCSPLHSPAHHVAGLPAIAMAMWGCLCPQGCVERATAISRSGASSCSGVRAQQSSSKCWGRARGPWGAARVLGERGGLQFGSDFCVLWVSTGASRRPAVSLSPRVAVRQRRSSPIHRHGLLLPATALAHSATRRRCVAGTALLLSIPGCCDTQLALERSPPHSCALVTWLCQLQAASWSWWLPLATWPCHSRAGAACHGAAAFRRPCNK